MDIWETETRTRDPLKNLTRYISTVETSKHRVFVFLDATILPDNKLVNFALPDAFHLGVLSSSIHVEWTLANSSRLGFGNDPVYVKTRCFDPFPFPDCTEGEREFFSGTGCWRDKDGLCSCR